MSPEYVRPYVKAQKNDDRDAEAITEAATRPTMRFVALKSEEQLEMQTLHRARDRLVGERTALVNQLRAILPERGSAVPQGRCKLQQHLAAMLDGVEFAACARSDADARRLATIPGIGVLNATALVAAVGNAQTFARGRDLASWSRNRARGARPAGQCGGSVRRRTRWWRSRGWTARHCGRSPNFAAAVERTRPTVP